ncbi:MAG TPA: hypothetical protein VGN02_06180, partial [Paenibacillus sp.]
MQLVHLYSYHPDAVWNQIFLTLIAYGLVMLVRKESGTTKPLWTFLKLLRNHISNPWEQFLCVLNREPAKHSVGRKKKPKMGRPRIRPKKYSTIKQIVD